MNAQGVFKGHIWSQSLELRNMEAETKGTLWDIKCMGENTWEKAYLSTVLRTKVTVAGDFFPLHQAPSQLVEAFRPWGINQMMLFEFLKSNLFNQLNVSLNCGAGIRIWRQWAHVQLKNRERVHKGLVTRRLILESCWKVAVWVS